MSQFSFILERLSVPLSRDPAAPRWQDVQNTFFFRGAVMAAKFGAIPRRGP
jgi:hypothetical protein